jgi:hypothetical protein
MLHCIVFGSRTEQLVAGTPPTVAVAPASNARPLMLAFGWPDGGPADGCSDSTNRGVNSDVLPPGSVAVPVIGEPFATAVGNTPWNVACPDPSVETVVVPRYVCPSGRSCGRREQTGLA